jgi:hypothetical protein
MEEKNMPIKPRLKTTNGSILGKNRKQNNRTNHAAKADSNAKKKITAEEYKKNKREIDQLLRSIKGRRTTSEVDLD